jgi:hypothetical protein
VNSRFKLLPTCAERRDPDVPSDYCVLPKGHTGHHHGYALNDKGDLIGFGWNNKAPEPATGESPKPNKPVVDPAPQKISLPPAPTGPEPHAPAPDSAADAHMRQLLDAERERCAVLVDIQIGLMFLPWERAMSNPSGIRIDDFQPSPRAVRHLRQLAADIRSGKAVPAGWREILTQLK